MDQEALHVPLIKNIKHFTLLISNGVVLFDGNKRVSPGANTSFSRSDDDIGLEALTYAGRVCRIPRWLPVTVAMTHRYYRKGPEIRDRITIGRSVHMAFMDRAPLPIRPICIMSDEY